MIYYPSIRGDFILDDDILLTQSELIKAPDGLYRFWCTAEAVDYWPVTNSSLWFEWRLWGDRPTGYHVTNVLLHCAASLLVWLLLKKLSIPWAFLAALLFAVHPVNVESVAWISQRKNILAMLFFLLSIFSYVEAELKTTLNASAIVPGGTKRWYGLSFFLFLLAMLSKGSAVILPPLLLLIVLWRRKATWQDAVRLMPFFAASAALTWVNILFQNKGSENAIRSIEPIARLLQAGAVPWFYLYKAFWPFDLTFVYPQWTTDPANPLWWIPLAASLGVTAVLGIYSRTWLRPLTFAVVFFLRGIASGDGIYRRRIHEIHLGS